MIKYEDIMPRAVTKETVKTEKRDDAYTVSIPRISSLPSISFTQILVVLLLIETFFLGSFYTKVQSLEKNGGSAKVQTADAQVQGAQTAPPAQAPPTGQRVEVDPGDLPMKGDPNAKVTLVEFSDFQCPFCEKLYTDTMPSIIKDYVDTGKVKLAFRHYPLPFHQNAQKTGEASECANDQGKFWEMHDKLFDTQKEWESLSATDLSQKLSGYAADLGLDTASFETCLSTEKYKTAVTDDMNEGAKVGVSATPTVYVNGIPVVGAESYSVFKQTIDAELAK